MTMLKTLGRSFAVAAVCAIVLAANAYSQTCPGSPGCLDPTFGIGGFTVTQVPLGATHTNSTRDMVFQSDGKIVILAYVSDTPTTFRGALVRFTADGSLDASFGSGGFAYITWGPGGASKLAIQTVNGEERFVVAGSECGSGCTRVERYTKWGVLDTTFGTGGATSLNVAWAPSAVAIQSDQKILLAGGTNSILRLKSNGTADTTYGPNGVSTTNPGMNIRALEMLSSGKVLAGGETWNGTSWDFALFRFNTNGKLDTTFGTKGRTSVDFAGKLDIVSDLTVDASGKILVSGEAIYVDTTPYPKGFDAVMIRLKSDGKLDTTFGSGGKTAPLNLGDLQDYFAAVSVQSNGKIVLTGESRLAGNNANANILTARYNANGTLDTSYQGTGWNLTEFYGSYDTGIKGTVRLDPTCNCQKFVVAGVAYTDASNAYADRYIALLRYSL